MALDYRDRYPTQTVDGGADYPEGKARNVGTPGDGTGTPLEADLLNDLWGFLQALTAKAGITVSGDVDTAVASDRLEALRRLTRRIGCQIAVSGSSLADNGNATLEITRETPESGFEVLDVDGDPVESGIQVKVPELGYYLVSFTGSVNVDDTANPTFAKLDIHATDSMEIYGYRYSTNPVHPMTVCGAFICQLDPTFLRLSVRNESGHALSFGYGILTVVRITGGPTGIMDGW